MALTFDDRKNFAYSTVATAPSPATSGTSLVVASGEGALFPSTPFNAVAWPAGTLPLASNAEVVRVTARSTDTLTITRAQEGSSAKSIAVGWQIGANVTDKTFDDLETVLKSANDLSGMALATSNQSSTTTVADVAGCTTGSFTPAKDGVIDIIANAEATSSGVTKHFYFLIYQSTNGGAFSDITQNSPALQGSGADFRNQGGVGAKANLTAGNSYEFKFRAKVDASTGQITASGATYMLWRVRYTS